VSPNLVTFGALISACERAWDFGLSIIAATGSFLVVFLPKPLNFYDPARDIIETGTCRHNFSPRNVFAALHVERLGTPATQQPRPARMASRFGICRLPCKSTLEVWVVGWQYANVGGNLHSL